MAYAKTHCHPILTLKAARVLQKLYLTMRSEARDGRSMPITMRQLESLVRLSQVRVGLPEKRNNGIMITISSFTSAVCVGFPAFNLMLVAALLQ